MNGLSLFTGIGGIDVALSEWVRPITYCEIEPYCQSVLLQRMQEGYLPKAPIWDDIRTLRDALFDSGIIYKEIDIIYGGFPCQDISIAGSGKGLEGERSGLFFEIMHLAEEIKPKFLFLENVPAITTRGGIRIVKEITALGYDCRWCIISASEIGALHRRERWFLLAQSMSSYSSNDSNSHSIPSEQTDKKTISISTNKKPRRRPTRLYWPLESVEHWKKTVSEICRVTNGVSNGLDRLKSLGNSVVPEQVNRAFKYLLNI